MTTRLKLPLEGDRVSLVADAPGRLSIVRRSDAATVGRVSLAVDGSTLIIRELCIEQPERGFGCGSDAARLLVHAAEDAGYGHVVASAPPNLGLAVYFWFRMGLRPLQGPGPGEGILLERRLSQEAANHSKET